MSGIGTFLFILLFKVKLLQGACLIGLPCSTTNNINNPIKVKTECNLFDNNYVGMIGSGDILDQGDYIAPNQYSAGNRFQGLASFGIVDLNMDWGVLWQDINTNNKYYYSATPPIYDNPRQILGSTGSYCINGNIQPTSDLFPLNNATSLNCSLVISRSARNTQNTFDSIPQYDISIYPNPANLQLIIESPFEQTIGFYVYNMQGKMAINGFAFKGKNFVNIEQLPSGLYIFRFQNGDTKKIEILK